MNNFNISIIIFYNIDYRKWITLTNFVADASIV